MLESAHLTASQLRLELDGLRSELLSYEDAILNARREIDNTKRERREVELNYSLVRDEYDMQIHKLMQARRDAEESEHDLRVRLSKTDAENVDLSERLNQLRQLEDEFNKKEHIIEELVIVNKQWERQVGLWEAYRGKKPTTPNIGSPTASGASSPSSAPAPAVRDMVSLLQSPPAVVGGGGVQQSELIPAEVFDAVKAFAAQHAKAETMVAALEAEGREQKVRLNEASRSIQSLLLQLERSANVHADLSHAMKSVEAQYMDEVVKVEHSLKTIHLLQKQKKDQQTLLIGYEERMKHFQQLLTAADVRADSANTFLSELLRGWNVLKYGNRQMNEVVKRMRAEYRRMRKERNDAYAELHDKLTKQTGDAAEFYADKERKVDGHYRQVMEENSRLHEAVDEERARADRLTDAAQSLVPKAKADEDLQAVHFDLDEMKRFVRAAEDKCRRLEEQYREAQDYRTLAEAEVARFKEEKEREVKAREAEAAKVKADGEAKAKADSMQLDVAAAAPGDSSPFTASLQGEGSVKREGDEALPSSGEDERQSKKRKLDAGGGEEDGVVGKREGEADGTGVGEAAAGTGMPGMGAEAGDVVMEEGGEESKEGEEEKEAPAPTPLLPVGAVVSMVDGPGTVVRHSTDGGLRVRMAGGGEKVVGVGAVGALKAVVPVMGDRVIVVRGQQHVGQTGSLLAVETYLGQAAVTIDGHGELAHLPMSTLCKYEQVKG